MAVPGEEDHVLLVHQEEPEEGDAALGVRGGNPASQQGAVDEAAGDVELQPRYSLVRATDDVEIEDTTGTAGLHAQRAGVRADFSGAAGSPTATAPAGAEPADAAGAETGPTFFAIDTPLPWALSVLMVQKLSNSLYIVTLCSRQTRALKFASL